MSGPASDPAPDWPMDDVAAWRLRAAARLQARPDLLAGLDANRFIPTAVDQAERYFGTSMASAGSPPIDDLTAAWICLNAWRSLATALNIARVIFNIPA
jgi:hypothetical protein